MVRPLTFGFCYLWKQKHSITLLFIVRFTFTGNFQPMLNIYNKFMCSQICAFYSWHHLVFFPRVQPSPRQPGTLAWCHLVSIVTGSQQRHTPVNVCQNKGTGGHMWFLLHQLMIVSFFQNIFDWPLWILKWPNLCVSYLCLVCQKYGYRICHEMLKDLFLFNQNLKHHHMLF